MTDISSRVKRIISGSANALISAIEDKAPEMIMEEAINEVDSAIEDVRLELGKTTAGKFLASKRLESENKSSEEIRQQIELAVTQGKDDLAKAGIQKQLDIEDQIPVLQNSISDATNKESELEGYIKALQAKRREMEAELVNFRQVSTQRSNGTTEAKVSSETSAQIKVDKASSAFDRILNRQANLPSSRGVSKNAQQLAELEELSRNNRIEERLAALKSK